MRVPHQSWPPFKEELQGGNYSGAVSFKQFLLPILAAVVIDGFMILKDLGASTTPFP